MFECQRRLLIGPLPLPSRTRTRPRRLPLSRFTVEFEDEYEFEFEKETGKQIPSAGVIQIPMPSGLLPARPPRYRPTPICLHFLTGVSIMQRREFLASSALSVAGAAS